MKNLIAVCLTVFITVMCFRQENGEWYCNIEEAESPTFRVIINDNDKWYVLFFWDGKFYMVDWFEI